MQGLRAWSILVLIGLAGCAAVKAAQPFGPDPAGATLATVKEQLITINQSVFMPRDLAQAGGSCRDNECIEWRRIDAAVTLAHSQAEQSLRTVQDPSSRELIAHSVGTQLVTGLKRLTELDGDANRRVIYQHSVDVVESSMRNLTRLPGVKKSEEGKTAKGA
jgi:hypothetical protein